MNDQNFSSILENKLAVINNNKKSNVNSITTYFACSKTIGKPQSMLIENLNIMQHFSYDYVPEYYCHIRLKIWITY